MDKDKPKPVPRASNLKSPRRRSSSSDSQEVEELRSPNQDTPEKDKDKKKERPRSSQQSRKNKRPTEGFSKQDRVRSKNNREGAISVEDDDDLNTTDFRRQLERHERDLTRRDRELQEERLENERCMDRIKKLERDKVELKREVEGLKDESEEYRRTLEDYKERTARTRKGHAMTDSETEDQDDINHNDKGFMSNSGGSFDITLQQKNREIEQFIEDIEKLEENKKSLQEKLEDLKDSLEEATKQIESMAHDHFNFKSKLQKSDERIKQLEEENTVISIRERDLLAFKNRHEQYLENLCSAVDIRVDVWKKMMFDKDEEIDRLNSKISVLMSQIPNTQMDSERSTIQQLHKKIGDREHHISLLNEKLAQATEEIESNTQLIESLQSKLTFTEDTEKTEQLVKSLQLKLRKCEEKLERKSKQLNSTEREADEKSQELTSLLSKMSAYESGEYGLPEAVSEIKDLKVQIRIRDKQVEGVTQEINILQMQVNDLQDENEMLREKLGLERQADVSRETRRYTRSRKNELTALRSKVTQLEEEIIHHKTKNYSLKKQLNQFDLSQQQPQQFTSVTSGTGSVIPERDRDRPDGGSVPSPKPGSESVNHGDIILKGMTGLGFRVEEWKEKYEIILEENTALRRGLHEILDCMHKMTDDGTADVMIQAPVLEELLREMSARGIINYPFPISSFHMKVCNLEGKCSQLREELHRLRQEERQCRHELFQAQGIIKILENKLGSTTETSMGISEYPTAAPRPRRPQRSRSRSPRSASSRTSSHSKKVTFDNQRTDHARFEEEALRDFDPESQMTSLTVLVPGTGRNLVLEDLQQEIELLRGQNDLIKEKFSKDKASLEDQLQNIIYKANELFNQKDENPKFQLKIEFLQAIKENQANEINSLIKKLSDIENENAARLGFLERFKTKALHQISIFQQILETSVPIHLLYALKKEFRVVTEKLEELKSKEETFVLKTIAFHKNTQEIAELRTERDKLEEDLGKCQARLLETAAQLEFPENEKASKIPTPTSSPRKNAPDRSTVSIESQNSDLTQKLNHTIKMSNQLKSQLEKVELSKKNLESKLIDLTEKCEISLKVEREAQEKTMNSISRDDYDLLACKLISAEETILLAKDEVLKWKEMAEMTQNQIKAIENIKDFDKMELDYLQKEVSELQSTSNEKALIAKSQRQLLTADKEKHLAIQQVQKLLSKLSQLEAHSLQQDKVHQEREMSLISMHTQVIMKYRSLFAALHESHSPKYNLKPNRGLQSQELLEAFEMFERTQKKCSDLEEQILEERLKVEEFEQKYTTLEAALNSLRDGTGQEMVFESVQKIQEARVEVARWKRKAEQKDRDCLTLRESVHRLEARTNDLEEDRIRLEHDIEIKESLASTLMAKSMDQIQGITMDTLSSTSIPLLSTSSTGFDMIRAHRPTEHKESQTEDTKPKESSEANKAVLTDTLSKDNNILSEMLERLRSRVADLEACLKGKDEVINEINFVRAQQERQVQRGPPESSDLQDALIVARESMTSMQDRLKSKDESVSQYRKLLAEVRTEMTNSTERHVQEMRALQMTIHQQQQAFTRMKTTLSQPVKDTLNVEGTIKDQLTRIHELEDEVSELQHAMGNVAAQLTAARSEAHRWRCNAENRGKEVDSAREQVNFESMEEINSLRQELRETHRRLEDSQQQLLSLKSGTQRDSMTELVNVLRNELEEKDKQIDAYNKSVHNLMNSAKTSEKGILEEQLHAKDKEVMTLKDEIQQLQKTISGLQVKISKTKAVNYKSGATTELDDLRTKCRDLMDDKIKLEKDLNEFQSKRDEDEQKKIKTAESVARWEESKKWKRNSEKLESRIKELEVENEKAKRSMQNLRITITRLEKEKLTLDSKLKSRQTQNQREGSASSTNYRFSDSSSMKSHPPESELDHQTRIIAQGEIARLNMEIQDLKELVEKTEFEGREEAETLKMEIKLLKERIVTQERQLTAYQIAQKGDPTAFAEIQNMAVREAQLQKEIRRLEEDNLHLNLQIEQLRLDTPRLRDRVQHLQKLVEALKAENPHPSQPQAPGKSNSQKSLGELEKTINALKVVIDKLQNENKRLKTKPHTGIQPTTSTERLKSSMDNLLEEKKLLMDKVQSLEHENEKFKKRYLGSNSNVEALENRLEDAEKRAKSAEMKLRTFLGDKVPTSQASSIIEQPTSSSYEALVRKMHNMQDDLDKKGKLLAAAKQSLREAEKATAPKSYACSTSKSTPATPVEIQSDKPDKDQ